MIRIAPGLVVATAGVAVTLLVSSADAQPKAADVAPRISTVQPGADRLLEDLQYLLSLTDEQEQEQWDTIESFFEEIFLLGIDRAKPVRIDAIVGDGPTRYRPSFPVNDVDDFLANLEAFGIESRKRSSGYYSLRDAFTGYLRVKDGYGSIGERSGDVPATMATPTEGVAALVEKDYDFGGELINTAVDAAAMKARREDFAKGVIEELLSGIGRLDGESKVDYDLRKTGIAHQLDELQRFYADTARLSFGWTTDVKTGRGGLVLDLQAIPDSELAKSVGLIGTAFSHFDSVPLEGESILKLRVNHPLDELRKKHLDEFYTLLLPSLMARIDAEKDKTDPEKTARKLVADKIVALMKKTAAAGLADGFVNVTKVEDGHLAIAGVRVVDGKDVDAIVTQLPAANTKIEVEANVATVGDVAVHAVKLPPQEREDFQFLFGKTDTLYVGTSKDAVWFAAGPDALAKLQETVPRAGQPVEGDPSGVFVDLALRLKPWMDLRTKAAGGDEGDPELRKLVTDGLGAGDDQIEFQLTREGEKVTGKMGVGTGLLRVAGKLLAKFSKENLE